MDDIVEQGCYVAVAGSFNPAIFSPFWLHAQQIVSIEEAEAADIDIIHKEVSRFSVANPKFDVLPDRCLIHAEAEPFARASDTMALLFADKLPHTPITGLVITYYVHAVLDDPMKRVRFGRKLAPLQPWQGTDLVFEGEAAKEIGGVTSLTMQVARSDDFAGFVRATVQPSHRVADNKGLFIQVEDHFVTPADKGAEPQAHLPRQPKSGRPKSAVRSNPAIEQEKPNFAKILAGEFNSSLERARKVTSHLLSEAEEA